MPARTSTPLKQAFQRFVELVKPIEDVRHVMVLEDGRLDFFTYVTKLDEEISMLVHEAEFEVMREFPDLPILFHVRCLEGRPFDTQNLSALSYSKGRARTGGL